MVNPLYSGSCPNLADLLDYHAKPVDACLGVVGLPQSATGQTALLTGVNAPQIVGRHVEGFPGLALRKIINEHNIFLSLRERGKASTFANGYFVEDIDEVRRSRLQSATTVATLGAFNTVRNAEDVRNNRAVYQDLTRQSLQARGYGGPLVTPEQAAAHLIDLTLTHDLTLFEYFQTDRAGHRCDKDRTLVVLSLLDAFLNVLSTEAERQDFLFVLTSDHGNVEDCNTRLHTLNAVPFVAVGNGAEELQREVESLTDVTPALIDRVTTA